MWGVSPMCTAGPEEDDTKVTDLEALGHAFRVLDVVGNVGRCFAWLGPTTSAFIPQAPWPSRVPSMPVLTRY